MLRFGHRKEGVQGATEDTHPLQPCSGVKEIGKQQRLRQYGTRPKAYLHNIVGWGRGLRYSIYPFEGTASPNGTTAQASIRRRRIRGETKGRSRGGEIGRSDDFTDG